MATHPRKDTRHRLVVAMIVSLSLFYPLEGPAEEIDYKMLYRKTAPAVVLIVGSNQEDFSERGIGTGSIIRNDGLVLTNTHVVSDGDNVWKHLVVFLRPETVAGNKEDLKRVHHAEVLARNPQHDLALLQIIAPPGDLPTLPLSDLTKIDIGEPTVAIGHPYGGGFWTMTTGRLSASFTSYRGIEGFDVFQTETPLNPGNSGGPLLDGSGAIIGINTFIIRQKGDMAITGINFAVKSTTAQQWIVKVTGEPSPDRHEAKLPPPPKRPDRPYSTAVKPGKELNQKGLEGFLRHFHLFSEDRNIPRSDNPDRSSSHRDDTSPPKEKNGLGTFLKGVGSQLEQLK